MEAKMMHRLSVRHLPIYALLGLSWDILHIRNIYCSGLRHISNPSLSYIELAEEEGLCLGTRVSFQ